MKLSVIVPVFNTEKFVSHCLDSLINQTHKDLEIVIVNDGSTDSSGAIINEYANKDNRIIIVNQKNQGLSAARNKGLFVASGDYVLFLDSDDYITIHAGEILYNVITKYRNLDIVTYSRYYYYNNNVILDNHDVDLDNVMSGKSFLLKAIRKTFPASVCVRAFSRKLLLESKLLFINGLLYEDLLFSISAFLYANRVVQISDALHYYRKGNLNSITNTISKKDIDVLKSVRYIEDLITKTNNEDLINFNFWNEFIFKWVSNATLFKYPIKKFFSIQGWRNCRLIKKDPIFAKYIKKVAFSSKTTRYVRISALLIYYNLFVFYCVRKITRPFLRMNKKHRSMPVSAIDKVSI